MERKKLIIILTVSLIASFLVGGLLGYSIAYYQNQKDKMNFIIQGNENAVSVDMSLFWKVWRLIEEKYIGRNNIDRKNMVYGAIEGLVNSLKDPYSVFLKPEDAKIFTDNMNGLFGGIGAEIGVKNGLLTIISPLEDSPAKQSGILPGDQILAIDGKPTEGLSLDEGVRLIRGDVGVPVVLTINREGFRQPKDIKIIRAIIKIPTSKFEIKNGVVILTLYNFNAEVQDDFKTMVEKVLRIDTNKIILDLRNNPGGYLETAVAVASWFLPKGEVVAIEDFGNGSKKEYRSYGYRILEKYKVVILINKGSASAAEILAGALRDHNGYKIVGEKSFGKGSVQEYETLTDGSSLKITTAKWLTPKGVSIDTEGIKPDIEVEMTVADIEKGLDPQLKKALEIINE